MRYFFLLSKKHERAHLLVVFLIQELEKKSKTIGMSEISAIIVIRLRRANDSPAGHKLFPVQCTTFS
jgi:hypothetical protein